jgi:hypothetical protein
MFSEHYDSDCVMFTNELIAYNLVLNIVPVTLFSGLDTVILTPKILTESRL